MKLRHFQLPRLAANYALLSGAELVSKLLAAIAFAYLARVLGPQQYGYLEFTLALVFLSTLVVDSGLSAFGARELARQPADDPGTAGRLLAHITTLRLLLAVVAYAVLFVLAGVLGQPAGVRHLIRLYGLTLFTLPLLILWFFQGRDRMGYVALASVIRWTAFSLGVFLAVRGAGQLVLVPLVEGVAILLAAIFLLISIWRGRGALTLRLERSYFFPILRQALPIGASEIVWAIKVYFATILLGLALGGAELGNFGAAHRIVISLHAFVYLYFYNLLPSLSRGSRREPEGLRRMLAASLQISAWSAVFLGAFGTAFAEIGIRLIYGVQYQAAAEAFRVLIWLIPLALMSGHYRYVLIGYDRQGLEFLSALLGAGVNIAANLLLIPRLGILGAAWALVISEAAIWLVAYYLVRQSVMSIPVFAHLWQPLLAGLVLGAALYLLQPLNIWLAGALAAILYAAMILLARPDLARAWRVARHAPAFSIDPE